MQTITINGLEIGKGRPWIVAPITGKTNGAIVEKAKELAVDPYVDIIEWRADHYENILDFDDVIDLSVTIRAALGVKPFIFSLRTSTEGGNCSVSDQEYLDLLKKVVDSKKANIVDVELLTRENAAECIRYAHDHDCLVMGSYHDFCETPSKEEIIEVFRQLQAMNADIIKVATMANYKSDVFNLMAASSEMYENYADRPLISIAMSPLGVISRVCSEFCGSSMVYGTVGDVSGSGQLPVVQLNNVLNILHKTYL